MIIHAFSERLVNIMKKRNRIIIVLSIIVVFNTLVTIFVINNLMGNNANKSKKINNDSIQGESMEDKVQTGIYNLVKWGDENEYIGKFYEDDTSADWFTFSYDVYADFNMDENVSSYAEKINGYVCDAKKYIEDNKGELYLTDYERMAIVLGRVGDDNEYVQKLLSENVSGNEKDSEQEINSIVFALIALDSNRDIFGGEYDEIRHTYIGLLKAVELKDGGFAYGGDKADVDMTAMAVQALAPYYDTDESVHEVIDRSLEVISVLQDSDGGFSSYGTANSESTSQVIIALCSLGINPVEDSRFVKSGNMIESLLSYQNEDGGFSHVKELDSDGIASCQAMEALTSYLTGSGIWSAE